MNVVVQHSIDLKEVSTTNFQISVISGRPKETSVLNESKWGGICVIYYGLIELYDLIMYLGGFLNTYNGYEEETSGAVYLLR